MEIGDSSVGVPSILSLPQDLFAIISRFLSPSDVCNLILCCKSLCELVDSDKTWLTQCEVIKVLPLLEVIQWRIGISSYKKLCRFLVQVIKPLIGIWVEQNPKRGNVVYVMSGFLSVVGCRIILQEIGSVRIQESQVLWSPVFEIICDFDGSTKFFLHGRDKEINCMYHGFVQGIEKGCNLLSLKVDPIRVIEIEASRMGGFPFWKLPLRGRRKLFKIVTSHVDVHVLDEPLIGRLFLTSKDDEAMMLERRTKLLEVEKFACNLKEKMEEQFSENNDNDLYFIDDVEVIQTEITPKMSLRKFFEKGIKHILGKSRSFSDTPSSASTPSISEFRHLNRQSLFSYGDTFGISLTASYTEVNTYKGWPLMDVDQFSLYKLPVEHPVNNQDYIGVWRGTFGWPLKKYIKGEPIENNFLLMLSYDESSDEKLLIATKILDCNESNTSRSEIFEVNIGTPSLEPFPFDVDGNDFEHSYIGKGNEEGNGFRNPIPKLGSLFVFSDDLLAFVWQETKNVITLQRLNLEEILKNGFGFCVSPLPPSNNFIYSSQ